MAAARSARRRLRRQRRRRPTTTCCAPPSAADFAPFTSAVMFGSVAEHLAERFGTKGSPISLSTACASGATAIQLGVEAIRRGETDAALCIGTDGSVNPEALIRFSLLSALSTSNDPPRARGQAVLQEPRRLRDGGRRRRAGARKPANTRRRAAPRSSASSKAAARWRTRSTAPARARTASRSSAASATRIADAGLTPDDIDYINPHGTGTPENDKMEVSRRVGRVRRARQAAFRSRRTSR